MPFVVHTSSRLDSATGVALRSHSIAEQGNGLYSVQCEFVCRASNSAKVDALFFPDAEPPIYPATVNKQYLLANRLFMSARDIKTENGLSFISASYVSGVTRQGRFGYVFTERESLVTAFVPIAYTTDGNLVAWVEFAYTPMVVTHEFVQVGNETTANLPPPETKQLYSLAFATGGGYGLNPTAFAEQRINAWRRTDESSTQSAAPSVAVKQVRHFIAEGGDD